MQEPNLHLQLSRTLAWDLSTLSNRFFPQVAGTGTHHKSWSGGLSCLLWCQLLTCVVSGATIPFLSSFFVGVNLFL